MGGWLLAGTLLLEVGRWIECDVQVQRLPGASQPAGDPWLDMLCTGNASLPFYRSAYTLDGAGNRQQINNVSSFLVEAGPEPQFAPKKWQPAAGQSCMLFLQLSSISNSSSVLLHIILSWVRIYH